MTKHRSMLIAALLAIFATPGLAQSERSCPSAIAIVERGQPNPEERWAYLYLHACGPAGAAAFARGMDASRQHTDVAALDDFSWHARTWRDSTIYASAHRIAGDATASPPARVLAIRYLLSIRKPQHVYLYENLIQGIGGTDSQGQPVTLVGCRVMMGSHGHSSVGVPLPADAAAQIATVFAQIRGDTTAPEIVRKAAECG